MDVLIKNFELPKSCYSDEFVYCPFQFFDFNTKSHCGLSDDIRCLKTKRPKDCPLVELPEHGRLIDAEKLQAVLYKWEESARCGGHYEFADAYKTVREIIDDRDCIVEANNG